MSAPVFLSPTLLPARFADSTYSSRRKNMKLAGDEPLRSPQQKATPPPVVP
jgi:hypothetical protein